jgi:hypothetical protein
MTDPVEPNPIAVRPVLYTLPGLDTVTVRRGLAYRPDDPERVADLYYPPGFDGKTRLPAVVIVAGYPDAGFATMVGRGFKDMGSTVSWSRLIAASGMAAVAYTNREPVEDLQSLFGYLRDDAASLHLDPGRLGVWSSSGNVPLALSLLMAGSRHRLGCAALCYGIMLDSDGDHFVKDAAQTWRFVNPCEGKSIDDLARDVPIFVARAGRDAFAGLNATLDRFVAGALQRNLPVSLANHPSGPHAFDIMDASVTTRAIVRQILTFLEAHLLA